MTSRQLRARIKRADRGRRFRLVDLNATPYGDSAGLMPRGQVERIGHRFYDRLDDGSLRRVVLVREPAVPSTEPEPIPAAEPSIRDEIGRAGARAARALYEQKVAALSAGRSFGPSADTKRKWLRVVERLEAHPLFAGRV